MTLVCLEKINDVNLKDKASDLKFDLAEDLAKRSWLAAHTIYNEAKRKKMAHRITIVRRVCWRLYGAKWNRYDDRLHGFQALRTSLEWEKL